MMNRIGMVLCAVLLSVQMMATEYLTQGNQAFEQEDYATAIECYTRHLAQKPKDAEALVYRAVAYMSVEDYTHAIEDATKAIDRWNKKCASPLYDYYIVRAMIYTGVMELEAAQADYDKAVKLGKNQVDPYLERGEFFYELRDYPKAEADYRQALSIEPNSSEIKLELARALLAQAKYRDAYTILAPLTKYEPNNVEARRLLALSYFYQNDVHAFVDNYILYLDENGGGDLDVLSYAAAEDYPYVVRAISRKINTYPKYYYWYGVRARIYRENEEYELALSDLQQYTQLLDTIESGFAYYQSALCYMGLYKYEEAIAFINKSIVFDTKNGYLSMDEYRLRANCYLGLNKLDSALADCDSTLKLAPADLSIVYHQRAWINTVGRRYDEVIKDYTQAIVHSEEPSYDLYMRRGRAYLLYKKDIARATADLEKALALDTVAHRGSVRHYTLAFLGRTEEAKAWLEQVLALDSEDEGMIYDAACLYARIGEKDKAIEYLKEAIAKGYDNFVHIEQDDDLDTLREMEAFKEIVAKRGGK